VVRPDGDRPGEDRRGDAVDGVGPDEAHDEPRAGDAHGDPAAGARPRGPSTDDDDGPGAVAGRDPICRAALWATGAFVVVSVLAAAWPDTFLPLSVPVDLLLFAAGCGAFLWAYALAIGRSRYETVTMAGLFFLSEGVAPPDVTRLLRGALAVQVAVAVAAASVRPFTALAFSVLVPMLGLGLMALWAARHGRFPPKAPERGD
jgi:hypothetical protein